MKTLHYQCDFCMKELQPGKDYWLTVDGLSVGGRKDRKDHWLTVDGLSVGGRKDFCNTICLQKWLGPASIERAGLNG